MVQAVELLPHKHKALSLNEFKPHYCQNKKSKMADIFQLVGFKVYCFLS
jgi:hypothetical protein